MTERTTAADLALPGGDFRLFVQKLGVQGMLGLGAAENPLTGRREVNLGGARMVVADLVMLREKTHGNLAADEAEHLDTVIEELERGLEQLEDANA